MENNVQSAAGITLIAALIAIGCGYALWRLLGGNVTGETSVATGRRWMNWIVLFTSISGLTKFFGQMIGGYGHPARALFEGVLATVFLATIAFAAGALVGRFRGGYSGLNSSGLPPAPNSAPAATKAGSAYSGATVRVTPVESTSPAVTKIESNETPVTAQNALVVDEDAIYATIGKEFEIGSTDKGLWTRLFAECDGDENRTKVAYIKQRAEKLKAIEHARFAEVVRQRDEEAANRNRLEAAEKARLASLSEEERTYELLPKGQCPNCKAVIPMASDKCPKCIAVFPKDGKGWKVQELTTPISAVHSAGEV